MKPSVVFFAALVYFTCLSVMLMVSLKISSGTADISDFLLQWGLILFTSASLLSLLGTGPEERYKPKISPIPTDP